MAPLGLRLGVITGKMLSYILNCLGTPSTNCEEYDSKLLLDADDCRVKRLRFLFTPICSSLSNYISACSCIVPYFFVSMLVPGKGINLMWPTATICPKLISFTSLRCELRII